MVMNQDVDNMQPVEKSFWSWLPVGFGLVGLILLIAFVAQFLLSVVAVTFVIVLVVWLSVAVRKRTVPKSQCPVCLYSLQGLSGSICPECGVNVITARRKRMTDGRRLAEAALCAYLIACSGLLAGNILSHAGWSGMSHLIGWPTYYLRGEREFSYRITSVAPEHVSIDSPRIFRTSEKVHVRVMFDTYVRNRDGTMLGTVHAGFGKNAPTRMSATGLGLADPWWTAEVELSLDPISKSVTILSELDTDALLDSVFARRLEKADEDPEGIDSTLEKILRDPDIRSAMKQRFATVWSPGLSTVQIAPRAPGQTLPAQTLPGQTLLGQFDRTGYFDREPSVRLENAGGGSSSRGGSGLYPRARTGYQITVVLGWLVTAFGVAAVLRWYGRSQPSLKGFIRAMRSRRRKGDPVPR